MDVKGPYRNGAMMLLVSAAMHLVALVLGAGAFLVPLLGGAVLALVVALGLFRGWRWLAYLAFLGTLIGAVAAMAVALQAGGGFGFWGIAAADGLAALALFGALWKDRPEPEEEPV